MNASKTLTRAEAPVLGRRERKAVETRRRMIEAAKQQMAEGGPESITIQAVTEGADIGQGTFYNYFKSRDELIDAVIIDVVENLGRRLDKLTKDMADPAEVYCVSARHLMHTAVSDPVWGWFMVRLGIAQEKLLSVLGPRASRDIQSGVDSGRFPFADVPLASAITFGSLLAVMHNYLEGDRTIDPTNSYAEALLRVVGLPGAEAADIAHRPLPPLPELTAEELA